MDLKEQIERFQAQARLQMPPEVQRAIAETTERFLSTDPARASLREGDRIPTFRLPNQRGEMVSAVELLARGPMVLTFYRGGWCPYCNLELKALHDALPQIREEGGHLVAVSPQRPAKTESMVANLSLLDFEVLSDVGNRVSRQFGLVFALDEALRPVYRQFGFDLEEYNGDASWELPIPATYVADPDGRIRYAFVDPDYTRRAEPATVLAALRGRSAAAA